MRSIDGDALFAVVKGHHDLYKGATNPADKARRDECLQVMCDINDAPTIDAIPVEWLKQWRDKLKGMGEYQQERAEDISFVLGLWEKEQGAQDG